VIFKVNQRGGLFSAHPLQILTKRSDFALQSPDQVERVQIRPLETQVFPASMRHGTMNDEQARNPCGQRSREEGDGPVLRCTQDGQA
jgi:hypothetical protein